MVDLPEGFIAHDGGPCPVGPDDIVDAIFRCGHGITTEAKLWGWNHIGNWADIIAYKPHTQGAEHG